METKVCKTCKSPRPLGDYYKSKSWATSRNPDGIWAHCKYCCSARAKKRLEDAKAGRLKPFVPLYRQVA